MNTSLRFLIWMISVLLLSACCQKGQNETGNRPAGSDNDSPAQGISSSARISSDSLKVQIGRFLDEWHNAASRADMQAYFDKIAEEGIFIGTDAKENWTKKAFYDWSKPFFDKGEAWSFLAEKRNIYLSEDRKMAWFDEELSSASGALRGSGLLSNKTGQWKIEHYVLSVPVPNEKFGEVMELIGE